MMNWEFENEILASGGIRENFICGTDEAGRGPLAGDVYAAAVILPHGIRIAGLSDSKKLSEKNRERLYEIIVEKALAYAVASATIEEIDRYNILNAALLAMRRSVAALSAKIFPDYVLVDGGIVRGFDAFSHKGIIKGDAISPNIAAASILAKVTRDRYMRELDDIYPFYHFKKNKGYATKEHIFRLKTFGECPAHRKSFLKNIISENFQTQIEIEQNYEAARKK
ncbi:MAG: ribonuclease HII [Oscillospiraceae bacterium]|nr:ribonuclease HII [Oscillospiraceae bacterium]